MKNKHPNFAQRGDDNKLHSKVYTREKVRSVFLPTEKKGEANLHFSFNDILVYFFDNYDNKCVFPFMKIKEGNISVCRSIHYCFFLSRYGSGKTQSSELVVKSKTLLNFQKLQVRKTQLSFKAI